MSNQRRSYSSEFKHESACLVLDHGYSIPEAARATEVGQTAMRRWVRQLKEERGGVTPSAKALTLDQQKIQQLQKRIERLEREKAILKKASVILMSDELDRIR
jgi:transposase